MSSYLIRDEHFRCIEEKRGFTSADVSTGATDGASRHAAAGTGLKLAADGSRMVDKCCCMSASKAVVNTL